MFKTRANNVMPQNVEGDDQAEYQLLPRVVAPPVIAPSYYNPIEPQQVEVNRLREQNQELQRLLELQAKEYQQFKEETNASIAALRQDLQVKIEGLRVAEAVLVNENQGLRSLLELQSREHQQFKETTHATVATILQEQQTNKQAISFLYDKLKETNRVAFNTGNCDVHGKKLPIPPGFDKQHCTFFTGGQGKYLGSGTGDVVPVFQTGDTMVLPYSGNCELPGGAYGVWAAKPIISEQELANKKAEYRLVP